MTDFFVVALGGALGAAGRYGISLLPVKTSFPILTLLTNLLGAILIGFLVGLTEHEGLSKTSVLFWKTGVCGGFTTFSTFSLEAVCLFENGKYLLGGIYVVCSVVFCLVGVFLGQWLGKSCLRLK